MDACVTSAVVRVVNHTKCVAVVELDIVQK